MINKIIEFETCTISSPAKSSRDTQPLIGISVNVDGETSRLHQAYIQSILDAGGVPLLIPATTDADALREAVERIDGLLLSGGSDVDGRYFGEETLAGITDVNPLRDAYDFLLLRLATDRQVPVFGICRGVQVVNIAFGGTIYQDIPSQFPGTPLNHSVYGAGIPRERPAHEVTLAEGSKLAAIFRKAQIEVNSRHHQALKVIAPGFQVTATAPDGVVEAIEGFPLRRIWGVQWHPENLAAEGGDPGTKALFRFFIEEADLFRRAKAIHDIYLTVDSHCDTPMLFPRYAMEGSLEEMILVPDPVDIGRRDPHARVELAKMGEGRIDASFMVAYLPQGERTDEAHRAATDKAREILGELHRQAEANAAYAGIARTFAEAEALKRSGKKAIFPGIENGYALGRDLKNLERFREMGVVYLTLCHNGANELCDSAAGDPEHNGLSPFGREVVREMNALGLVIDLSHAAEKTFYDVLEASATPVICSHSSARTLCDHRRNLTDDQLRALAAKDGVVQVCLYGGFLRREGEATLLDAADHIDHLVSVAGISHVGIGSDFDGGGGIPGCDASNELINLTVELLRRGYTPEQIGGIWGGNLRRAIDAIQQAKTR